MTEPTHGHDEEGYAGPVTVVCGDHEHTVTVTLRGLFQPIDGRYHWYGRLAADPDLAAAVRPGTKVTVRTTYGEAEGTLSDLDPWGRYRVAGHGRPPFPVGAAVGA